MKKKLLYRLFIFLLSGFLSIESAFALQKTIFPCDKYSDTFETFNLDHWKDILLLSRSKGIVKVENGYLMLQASEKGPCEIQVYSLFTFENNFDIQVDYDISNLNKHKECRFNTGIVLQTMQDEISYKCYVAKGAKTSLIFRSRIDRFGEKNIEKHKTKAFDKKGTIRIVRNKGQIKFLILNNKRLKNKQWNTIYKFKALCREKLRLRIKLQTGEDKGLKNICPLTIKYDNFKVNSCYKIIEE